MHTGGCLPSTAIVVVAVVVQGVAMQVAANAQAVTVTVALIVVAAASVQRGYQKVDVAARVRRSVVTAVVTNKVCRSAATASGTATASVTAADGRTGGCIGHTPSRTRRHVDASTAWPAGDAGTARCYRYHRGTTSGGTCPNAGPAGRDVVAHDGGAQRRGRRLWGSRRWKSYRVRLQGRASGRRRRDHRVAVTAVAGVVSAAVPVIVTQA